MDGTETGWGRPAEPAPRWRALLDRARHGGRSEEPEETPQPEQQAPWGQQQPGRAAAPVERRPFNPLDPRSAQHGQPAQPERRAAEPDRLPQRPINPLDPRWQARREPEQPGSFFEPGARSAAPTASPTAPPTRDFGAGSPSSARDFGAGSPSSARDFGAGSQPSSARDFGAAPTAQPQASPPARDFGSGAPGYGSTSRDYPAGGFPPAVNGYQAPPAATGYPAAPQANGYAPGAGGYAGTAYPPQAPAPQAPAAPAPSAQAPSAQAPAAQAPSASAYPATAPAPAYPRNPAAQGPVVPPQAAPRIPAAAPAPEAGSPPAARIEWRQTRTDDGVDRAASVLRRKLGKPRVLAFANPKGGVHKTTATVLAAATIGSVRGRGVLAWDDNELRGTLGLRAGSARHARTIKHLLADLMRIESLHGDALLQELDAYLRHASDGSYDVLAGEENPRFAQRLDQDTVRRVTDLLRRTHDVICVDTGNNVESVNWQTVMRTADQLVITTVPREDAAFTADWMLDVLEESGMGEMVANAVTLISCPSPGPLPLLEDFKKHFATRTRAVAVVPYDPALEVGSSIEYGDLQAETRQAWLRAASTMLEPFAE
ncbi:AAA family ATPase [Actinoplanes sp. DH11]|uniref:AAA family ATPase n=1 Tax=Actinoplanes sp. DH11 TaxID=2857011 RepID=UPI001E2EF7A1|nr:AAA family ATPase [Actinoplanes sp. DH11]